MARNKTTKKVAVKKTAKKAAKKAAKKVTKTTREYKIRVTNPDLNTAEEEKINTCNQLSEREIGYMEGHNNAFKENPLIQYINQITGIKGNIKYSEKQQANDRENLIYIQARMMEREISIERMKTNIQELQEKVNALLP